jgi:hypothetical protein
MNPFQWLSILVLSGLLVWELLVRRRTVASRGFWLLRCLAWITAAVAIALPDLVQAVAQLIGIGRGADVVLYLVALTFLGTSFYFYSRYVQLQRQITQLVRHLALQDARRGGNGPHSSPD